jgi:4-hydroxy-3-polyprenylbenzoate decarboxylase
MPSQQPAEILTIANHIFGTGQLSLAKFLFITATNNHTLTTQNVQPFLSYILERIHLDRDLHFYTNTTIDTLDYSGEGLNAGSKVAFAAYGSPIRSLATELFGRFLELNGFGRCKLIFPGVIALEANKFLDYNHAAIEMNSLSEQLIDNAAQSSKFSGELLAEFPLIIVCDDAEFTSATVNNFVWVSFTRCNPSHDIYGVDAFVQNKHWGCRGSLIIDARIKPHHAPPVEKDPVVEKKVDRLFSKGGSLYGKIS